ncbi:MAG: PEP-utilizing enzyme [Dehalococcoidales bacterium]
MPDANPMQDAPSSIPLPPDFPVTWEDPTDEMCFWTPDPMHFPEPVTPLMDIWFRAYNEGFYRASKESGLPIHVLNRQFNSRVYMTTALMVPPEQMEAQGKVAEASLNATMARFWDWWESELLPEVKENLAYWEGFDLPGASLPALITHLEETQKRLTRLVHIHFLIAPPFLIGPSLFDELYQDIGLGSALDAYRLLMGFGNKTTEGDQALWGLSRKALASPPVRSVLESNEPTEVTAALEQSADGRAFLADLNAFLEEFGHRSDIFCELSDPTWLENPTTPIRNLQAFLAQTERDLPGEMKAQATERERLITEARSHLKGYPEAVVGQFEFFLETAQAGIVIQEDHNYWIDQRCMYQVRLVLLEFGRRLAEAGVIDEIGDVFFLTPDELPVVAAALPKGDQRELVVQRKAEIERFRAIQPPAAFGTMPPGPPPDDPMGRAMGKMFGPPPQPLAEADVLQGAPCSAGKVRGPARVVMSLAQADKLQPGDVMVAPATMPAWTPLFASISAVVTDAGGALCHAAIVAREYGIPAVLGTGMATSVIKDGQTLEVDGAAGTVRIVAS